MTLTTPSQRRLYGSLRRYMFPYALLLGIAMGAPATLEGSADESQCYHPFVSM